MELLLIVLALLPSLLIGGYIYKKDKNKEPYKLLIILFLCGIVSTFITIFASECLEPIFPFVMETESEMTNIELLIDAFLLVGLIEESSKWIFVYKLGYKNKEFDETYDMIIYSTFVSLGFATFENLLYILDDGTLSVAIVRGLLSIPGHVAYAIFMGYYLCLAKLNKIKGDNKKSKINLIKSILIPTIIHGSYDYLLFKGESSYLVLFFGLVVFIFSLAFTRLRKAYEKNRKLNNYKRKCINCNTIHVGSYCPNCGTRQD